MVDIQTISIMLASASVIAGVVYYALQLRHQARAKQMDVIMKLHSTWLSKEMLQSWEILRKNEFRSYMTTRKNVLWRQCR
jgi:hypothetical protein